MLKTMELQDLKTRLKRYIVERGARQRKAKLARRTVRIAADVRARLLRELGLEDHPPAVQAWVDRQRFWLTVAHVLYGEERGRPHPVSELELYRRHAKQLVDVHLSG